MIRSSLIRQASVAGKPIDPLHAFYLGYEMSKAATALALGKQYTQDQALSWGFLTVPEISHRDRAENKSQSEFRTDRVPNVPDRSS